MQFLEETKGFTYNNSEGKTEIMPMSWGNNKNKGTESNKPIVSVKKGAIGYTEKYKLLGDQYDKTGKNMPKIAKKMEKAKFIAGEVRRQGSYERVGHADTSTRLLLMEMVVKPTLLFNTETWINITKQEMDEVNKGHYLVLRKVLEQKDNIPYYGLLLETGLWPYSYVIIYKRIMMFHNLIHSKESRIARKIVINQMNGQGKGFTWYQGVDEWLDKLELEKEEEAILQIKKSKWKKRLKEKLGEWIKNELEEQKKKMKKLRFTNTTGRQEYMETCSMSQVKKILELRLNMTELKANYRGKYTDAVCPACQAEEETTEHVIQCPEYKRLVGHKLDEGEKPLSSKMNDLQWLKEAANVFQKIEETRKWLL